MKWSCILTWYQGLGPTLWNGGGETLYTTRLTSPSSAQTPGQPRSSPGSSPSTVLGSRSPRNSWNQTIVILTLASVRCPRPTGMGESLSECESHSSWGWRWRRSSASPTSEPPPPLQPRRKLEIFASSGHCTLLLVWVPLHWALSPLSLTFIMDWEGVSKYNRTF